MNKWVIGVDEAGRGPLAGPVAVGVALVPADFDWDLLPGVHDSKQLSEAKREAVYRAAASLRREGFISWSVSMVGAGVIDRKGIVFAINSAMKKSLNRLKNTPIDWSIGDTHVLLDGGLKAPVQYVAQKTIIKGDQKEKTIGLASIVAKVTRDRYMVRMAALPPYAPYTLAIHKGYGTKAHREAIKKHGLSDLHRATYCRGCVNR